MGALGAAGSLPAVPPRRGSADLSPRRDHIPGDTMLTLFLALSTAPYPDGGLPVRLDDLRRFPPRQASRRHLACALKSADVLAMRHSIEHHRSADLWEARGQACRAAHAWGLLAAAQDDRCERTARLLRLVELRDALGAADYCTGTMPCPVPLWAFPEGGPPPDAPWLPH